MAKAINTLKSIISLEEAKIKQAFPVNEVQKKAFLFEIIRSLDTFFLFTQKSKNIESYYRYGFNEALHMLYGPFVLRPGCPLFPSNNNTLGYANFIMQQSGKIGFCKQIISYVQAGLAKVSLDKNKFFVVLSNKAGIAEQYDNDAVYWAQKLLKTHISNPGMKETERKLTKVRKIMRKQVHTWREYFIQYGANPEIDEYFDELAFHFMFSEVGKEEFPADAKFGGIPYHDYCRMIIIVCGVAMKHYYFCLELLGKNKSINPVNIITIPKDWKYLAESFGKYIDVSTDAARQMLNCITITEENHNYHTVIPEGSPPPFIKIGSDSLIHSIIGSQANPFIFLNRELKRRFEKDYFNAVNNREGLLRRQVYYFFAEDNYFRVDKTVLISSAKGNTDIDGIVYDTKSKSLAIFQFKWQDIYGSSMKERYSRISNLYPKVIKWIDKVESWLLEVRQGNLLSELGINISSVPKKTFIFIICRHNAFFTNHKSDRRAVWTNIWRMLEVFSKIPMGFPNKIEIFYNELKKSQDEAFAKVQQIEDEQFQIGQYEIVLKVLN